MATKAYAIHSEENNEGKGVSSCVGSKTLLGLTKCFLKSTPSHFASNTTLCTGNHERIELFCVTEWPQISDNLSKAEDLVRAPPRSGNRKILLRRYCFSWKIVS
jgi:hypothetical protein